MVKHVNQYTTWHKMWLKPAISAWRALMARINVGTTANDMDEAAWNFVGQHTAGYSGADLAILVRDAMMEPIRMLQTATYFKTVSGVDRDGTQRDDMCVTLSAEP